VKVGNNQGNIIFIPDDIKANVGTFVEFQFYPLNHSVAESSFGSPCEPLTGSETIFSGFQPVSKGATNYPTYTIRINSTTPIWLYCTQEDHCQSGMNAVINAPTSGSKTLAAYKKAAAAASKNVSPSKIFGGVEGSTSKSSASSSGSPSGTSTPTGTGTSTGTSTGSASSAKSSSGASSEKATRWGVAAGAAAVAGLFI
jgi:plastocyanin